MSDSILKLVREKCNVAEGDKAFDSELLLHINSAFFTLKQLKVGPAPGFTVEGETEDWDEFLPEGSLLNEVKTYVCLKTRYEFDPPGTGYHTTAMKELVDEAVWRISAEREDAEWVAPPKPEPVFDPDIWADSL